MDNSLITYDSGTGLPDELLTLKQWLEEGRKVALATVVQTWGSSPRATGSHLVIDEQTNFVGSVSGGCIEGAVVSEALEVISDGMPKLLEFGVSNEEAWEVGLTCGGAIQIFVEPVQ
jgi:xanthine/CO dehydrogenase XdhC/CoxF family maturation factor